MITAPLSIKVEETATNWVSHQAQFDIHMFAQHATPTRYPANQRDWESHKTEIAQRYADEELRSLMSYMQSTYQFVATEKQWKSQLRKWDMKKRTGGSDYKAILKKKRERERARPGIQTEFFLKGKKVSAAKIQRYEDESRKKGRITDDDTFADVPTPPYLSFGTPPTSPTLSVLASTPSDFSLDSDLPPFDQTLPTIPVTSDQAMMYYMNYAPNDSFSQAEQSIATSSAFVYPPVSSISYSPAATSAFSQSASSTYPDPTLYSSADYAADYSAYYRTSPDYGRR